MWPTPAAKVSQLQTLDFNISGPNSLYTAAYGKELIPIITQLYQLAKLDHAQNLREKMRNKVRENCDFFGGSQHTEIYATLVEIYATFALFHFFKISHFFSHSRIFSHIIVNLCIHVSFHVCRNQLDLHFFPKWQASIKHIYRLVGRRDLYSGGTCKCRFPRK